MEIYKRYFEKYKIPFVIAVICVAFEAICDLLGPTLMAHIINDGINNGQMSSVMYWGGMMLLATLVGACFAATRNILASRVSQKMGAELRTDLFQKIMNFAESSVDKIESGSLITRMTNDTNQITQFVNGVMRIFMKAPITCIGSIILATMLNFKLSIIIYVVVVIIFILIYFSMKLSYPRFAKLQQAMDKVNSVVQEYLIGIRLVKAFGTYDEEVSRFDKTNQNVMKKGVSAQMVITLMAPLMSLLIGLGTVAAIWAGSKLFLLELAKPGDIAAFTIYMAQILTSIMMITNIFMTFVRTKASTARVSEIFHSEEDFSSYGQKEELRGGISFHDVTFTYPNGSGVPAIKNLSFSIGQGENLAIIGPTGSGKSTICWLLLRFYDIDKGQIMIGGTDITDVSIETLRNSISIVPQKPMLFSGTVADNLKWGNKNASETMVHEVAGKAQADFITKMKHGYQSILSSSAVNISGGQKQRISIARGLLKNTPILILDDATSALDAVTEAGVRNSLNKERDKTIITVTQRCTTAMFAHKILVMENGYCVGFGTHTKLLAECSMYEEIYRSQVDGKVRLENGKQ